ncbi:MAG: RIO1 family regulatory kinase/ATPase domain-containing protein [Promethearchaeota archaeon]|jgi:RIO kinase 2
MEIANLLPTLEKEDFRILMAIEVGMRRSKFVTVKNIKFYSRYKIEETLFRLNKVHKLDLIIRDSSKHDVAYTLNSKAYDLLALHTLVEKNVISQLGPLIGKGKESDVYSCMDDEENIFALKFYRMGRTSFRGIKKFRDIIGDRSHYSWLYVNRLAAKREFEALEKVYSLKLNTPKPIAFNRHVIVMSYLRGKELVYFKSIKNPQKIFNRIIRQMKTIFQKLGMIHGDLGEFNIVLDEKGNILIIDWLQWVSRDHPNSKKILKRDLENICSYFEKKFNIRSNLEEIIRVFFKK